MARLAIVIKDLYQNKYKNFSKQEKDNYNRQAQTTYKRCMTSYDKFVERRNVDEETRVRLLLSIEENMTVESLIANPENPLVVLPLAQQTMGGLYSTLLDEASDSAAVEGIVKYIETNTNTPEESARDDELLKNLRFVCRYYAIGDKEEDE